MKMNIKEGFELHRDFLELVNQYFGEKYLDYHKITQESHGGQKFIKIELSIKVE